jgi:hypothetical protein
MKAAAQIIGVSATFRGDAGIKKITSILTDSTFIYSPHEIKEKELHIEVFGPVLQKEI